PFPALAAAVRGRALGDTVCPLPGHAAVRIQGLGDTTWNPVDAPARDPAVDAARSPALAATARGLSLARVQDHAAARALAETADHGPTPATARGLPGHAEVLGRGLVTVRCSVDTAARGPATARGPNLAEVQVRDLAAPDRSVDTAAQGPAPATARGRNLAEVRVRDLAEVRVRDLAEVRVRNLGDPDALVYVAGRGPDRATVQFLPAAVRGRGRGRVLLPGRGGVRAGHGGLTLSS